MQQCRQRLDKIAEEFRECRKALTAIGDETRQQIILALLESDCNGIRVGEITKKTNLSRPAVSHHLRILREADIINMRREGTKNYYYMDANEMQWNKIMQLISHIYATVKDFAPIDMRKGED
ncbi:MAG: metalloregulator ArsR/SmtB family transcription factor [Candidatus Niameybacter stercoravium]|nr:metalloregulator ArsR/SmtB family transcription factor [Candidatus Niameybacter stercoravium]